jgi:hypothetical protein
MEENQGGQASHRPKENYSMQAHQPSIRRKQMSKDDISPTVNAVGEHWVKILSEVDQSDLDLKDRIKFGAMATNLFFKSAALILTAKSQMLKSPDVAGRDVVLSVSSVSPKRLEG